MRVIEYRFLGSSFVLLVVDRECRSGKDMDTALFLLGLYSDYMFCACGRG